MPSINPGPASSTPSSPFPVYWDPNTQSYSIGAQANPPQPLPQTLLQGAVPFVYNGLTGAPSATGAGTFVNALPYSTYPVAGYLYCPAGFLSTGSTAAWYYFVASTSTALIIYNNVYVTGIPTLPTQTVAFAGLSGGTGTTSSTYIQGPNTTVPAGVMGNNGSLNCQILVSQKNSAALKQFSVRLGLATDACAVGNTTVAAGGFIVSIKNRGQVASQICAVSGDAANALSSVTQLGINTAVAQNIGFYGNTSATGEYVIIENYQVILYPTVP